MTLVCHIYKSVKDLLPHFYKHYHKWGVNRFCFGVYGGSNNPVWDEILALGQGLNIERFHSGNTELNVDLEGDFKNQIRTGLKKDDWLIPTDLDEFHTVEGYTTFQEVQKDCEAEGAEYVPSSLFDRIKPDGSIPLSIDSNLDIWEQFPMTCRISDTIAKAYCRKLCMVQPHVVIAGGHHDVKAQYKKFSKMAVTYHFKWFGNLYQKEMEKFNLYTAQKRKFTNEQHLVLEFLRANNGKLLQC